MLLVAFSFLAASILLAIAQLSMFKKARRAWNEQIDQKQPAWTKSRIAAYIVYIVLSLFALPAGSITLLASFAVAPWEIMWLTAALFTLDGLVGLSFAAGLIARPERRAMVVGLAAIGSLLVVAIGYSKLLTPTYYRSALPQKQQLKGP